MSETPPVDCQTNREDKVLVLESESPKSAIKFSFYRQMYKAECDTENEHTELSETIVESNETNNNDQVKSTDNEERVSSEDREQRRQALEAEAEALEERLRMLREEKHQLFNALRAILPERD